MWRKLSPNHDVVNARPAYLPHLAFEKILRGGSVANEDPGPAGARDGHGEETDDDDTQQHEDGNVVIGLQSPPSTRPQSHAAPQEQDGGAQGEIHAGLHDAVMIRDGRWTAHVDVRANMSTKTIGASGLDYCYRRRFPSWHDVMQGEVWLTACKVRGAGVRS